ncbi:uncharacterized protein ACO6RY_13077 [Pungitius sinensis]
MTTAKEGSAAPKTAHQQEQVPTGFALPPLPPPFLPSSPLRSLLALLSAPHVTGRLAVQLSAVFACVAAAAAAPLLLLTSCVTIV